MRHRSRNSDLLIPQFMEKQIRHSLNYYRGRRSLLLHRITAFVTHKCNMFCHYCNGPHITLKDGDSARKRSMLNEDLSVASYQSFLKDAIQHTDSIQHVHFTGGEASVKKYLPELVKINQQNGILSSITSNGLAGKDYYRSLIDNGLTEIRISFDSSDAPRFERSVGVPGSFQTVTETIRDLNKQRDEEKKDIFIVINSCVGEANLDRIQNTMDYMLSLNPNDLKFLLIVQDKDFVIQNRNAETIEALQDKVKDYPKSRYYLLRRKINSLFVQGSSGVEDSESQKEMARCYIPMTERTIDGQHYYPCSIYTRYYGEPIGSIDEPFEVQQEKTMAFVENHECRDDPICQKYCVNCCKIYNVIMNIAVEADKKIVKTSQVLEPVPISAEIRAWAEARSRQLFKATPEAWAEERERLFLILKPYGLEHRASLLALIAEEGLEMDHSLPIDDWHGLAPFLYSRNFTSVDVIESLERSLVFRDLEGSKAEYLCFKADPSPDILLKLKYKMRRLVPSKQYQFNKGEDRFPIHMTVVHSSDELRLGREHDLLYHALPALRTLQRVNDLWVDKESRSVSV
ncbi:MAG: radical SAM protein [Planctomycetota bacterium]|nr:radical SAM protein [Planctomycetota bacterium]